LSMTRNNRPPIFLGYPTYAEHDGCGPDWQIGFACTVTAVKFVVESAYEEAYNRNEVKEPPFPGKRGLLFLASSHQ
jgi:hypothetical protein